MRHISSSFDLYSVAETPRDHLAQLRENGNLAGPRHHESVLSLRSLQFGVQEMVETR